MPSGLTTSPDKVTITVEKDGKQLYFAASDMRSFSLNLDRPTETTAFDDDGHELGYYRQVPLPWVNVKAEIEMAKVWSEEPPKPAVDEVTAALNVLSRAGWRVRQDTGYGRCEGGFLVSPLTKLEGASRYTRWSAQEPWKEA